MARLKLSKIQIIFLTLKRSVFSVTLNYTSTLICNFQHCIQTATQPPTWRTTWPIMPVQEPLGSWEPHTASGGDTTLHLHTNSDIISSSQFTLKYSKVKSLYL